MSFRIDFNNFKVTNAITILTINALLIIDKTHSAIVYLLVYLSIS